MITDVDPLDLTCAQLVKKGLLQTDKITKWIQVGITGGDHEDPEYIDGLVTMDQMKNISMDLAPIAREIGGGQAWYRRGVAKLECYFIKQGLTEDIAFDAGYTVLGRLMSAIEQCPVAGITDDYGEQAVKLFCPANTYFESGGPPNQYIFRGKVFWVCWTERP